MSLTSLCLVAGVQSASTETKSNIPLFYHMTRNVRAGIQSMSQLYAATALAQKVTLNTCCNIG